MHILLQSINHNWNIRQQCSMGAKLRAKMPRPFPGIPHLVYCLCWLSEDVLGIPPTPWHFPSLCSLPDILFILFNNPPIMPQELPRLPLLNNDIALYDRIIYAGNPGPNCHHYPGTTYVWSVLYHQECG